MDTEDYQLVNYSADKIKNTLYIVEKGLKSPDIMELIKRIEKLEIDITRIVVYAPSVKFNEINELKTNIANLRNNKYIELIERY